MVKNLKNARPHLRQKTPYNTTLLVVVSVSYCIYCSWSGIQNMAQFYFTCVYLELLEGRGLIFSKIGTNLCQGSATNTAKHHKTQMYPKYFLILFLAQNKLRVQEFSWNSIRAELVD